VFVSGIGCAARFPYYLSTYGFHTIHGRAPAIATGIQLANPELDVWVITGDGDGLSIGGNHMLHVLRRNVDLQIVLFNNEIYGLTKGQYSPTSRRGTRSPSTPQGSIENPVSPCAFALGAGARFVGRAVDTQQADVVTLLKRAHAHKGASFVEVFQNCVVFNDGVFDSFTAKTAAPDAQLHLEHGKPLLFRPRARVSGACASRPGHSRSRSSRSVMAACRRTTSWCTTRPTARWRSRWSGSSPRSSPWRPACSTALPRRRTRRTCTHRRGLPASDATSPTSGHCSRATGRGRSSNPHRRAGDRGGVRRLMRLLPLLLGLSVLEGDGGWSAAAPLPEPIQELSAA